MILPSPGTQKRLRLCTSSSYLESLKSCENGTSQNSKNKGPEYSPGPSFNNLYSFFDFFSCLAKRFSFSDIFGSFLVFALLFCSLLAICKSLLMTANYELLGFRLPHEAIKRPDQIAPVGLFLMILSYLNEVVKAERIPPIITHVNHEPATRWRHSSSTGSSKFPRKPRRKRPSVMKAVMM